MQLESLFQSQSSFGPIQLFCDPAEVVKTPGDNDDVYDTQRSWREVKEDFRRRHATNTHVVAAHHAAPFGRLDETGDHSHEEQGFQANALQEELGPMIVQTRDEQWEIMPDQTQVEDKIQVILTTLFCK